ncbi:MAG: hypothetical protein KAX05_06440 [Bacteroidales bacterium]|nr:hypothetical protein [Bacteroidales bacterium]
MENYKDHPFYQPMDLENIFSKTWEVYKKNFRWLFLYSFLGILLLQMLMYYTQFQQIFDLNYLNDIDSLGKIFGNLMLFGIILFIGYAILYLFIHYFIIYREIEPDKSHLIFLGDSVRKYALTYLATILLVFFILIAGAILGLIAFIIGSFIAVLYFGAVFFPISPLVIVEKTNPFESISRSFRLVHTNFWPTLGYIVLLYIILMVISLVLGAITMAPFAVDFFKLLNPNVVLELFESGEPILSKIISPGYILLSSVANAITFPVVPIFAVLVYFNLRYKEDHR